MDLIGWLLLGLCAAAVLRRVPFGRAYGRPGDLAAGLGGALLGGLITARLLARAAPPVRADLSALAASFGAACLLIVLLRVTAERRTRLGRIGYLAVPRAGRAGRRPRRPIGVPRLIP
jgi:uncharacterized membrane protein YeaQ/YmgE (transglycosylase-associated protein family)